MCIRDRISEDIAFSGDVNVRPVRSGQSNRDRDPTSSPALGAANYVRCGAITRDAKFFWGLATGLAVPIAEERRLSTSAEYAACRTRRAVIAPIFL